MARRQNSTEKVPDMMMASGTILLMYFGTEIEVKAAGHESCVSVRHLLRTGQKACKYSR